MQPVDLLGIGSAFLALVAFAGNQYGKLRADNFWYDAMNFLSAIGLLVYAADARVVPFMLTNSVWAFVSGIDVIRHLLRRRR